MSTKKLVGIFLGIVLVCFWISVGLTVLTFGWPEGGWSQIGWAGLIGFIAACIEGGLGFLVVKLSGRW